MEFSILADSFNKMESTRKRLELTQYLVELFEKTPQEVISKIVYLLQGKLRPDFEGIELGVSEKLVLRAVKKSLGVDEKDMKNSLNKTGDLGIAISEVLTKKTQKGLFDFEFNSEKYDKAIFESKIGTVERVYEVLWSISQLEGAGKNVQDKKINFIASLLNKATPIEAKFVTKLLLGTLRLGIAENTIMDSLAITFTGTKENRKFVEEAYNVSSDLGKVAETLLESKLEGLLNFEIKVFNPVRPMLANRVKSEEEAIEKMGNEFALEYKLDGERAQIHINEDTVKIFSRSLEIITMYYPDIVERIGKNVKSKEIILEAEIVAINKNEEFLPFQELMHRRRKYNIEKAVMEYPITVNFFDVLLYNGKSYLNFGYDVRRALLEDIIRDDNFAKLVPQTIITKEEEIVEFMENSINAGGEGLMLKKLESNYFAGSRGNHWLKLKREYRNELGDSLDLVVIGGFFGKGRRTGSYGTLLLATYDEDTDTFTSICKVGTGFSDEDLDQLYQILNPKVTIKKNPRIDSEMEADVWFEPELVIEVVASEITLSPIHKAARDAIRKDAGFALRFPKFTGKIRVEKMAEDASTNEEVITLYQGQKKVAHDKSLM